jgi:hypothetical protein
MQKPAGTFPSADFKYSNTMDSRLASTSGVQSQKPSALTPSQLVPGQNLVSQVSQPTPATTSGWNQIGPIAKPLVPAEPSQRLTPSYTQAAQLQQPSQGGESEVKETSQKKEISPPPKSPPLTSSGKRRQFLINPLTGHLEPMPSDSSSDSENEAAVDSSFPFVERSNSVFSDEEESNVSTLSRKETDQSDSEATIKSTASSESRKISGVRSQELGSPSQTIPVVAQAVHEAGSPGEKIKLRLKLEKKEPVTPAYKVDVSYVNVPPVKKIERPSSSNSNRVFPGIATTTVAPMAVVAGSPTVGEPRVPPLHISLRGRNAAVVVGSRSDKELMPSSGSAGGSKKFREKEFASSSDVKVSGGVNIISLSERTGERLNKRSKLNRSRARDNSASLGESGILSGTLSPSLGAGIVPVGSTVPLTKVRKPSRTSKTKSSNKEHIDELLERIEHRQELPDSSTALTIAASCPSPTSGQPKGPGRPIRERRGERTDLDDVPLRSRIKERDSDEPALIRKPDETLREVLRSRHSRDEDDNSKQKEELARGTMRVRAREDDMIRSRLKEEEEPGRLPSKSKVRDGEESIRSRSRDSTDEKLRSRLQGEEKSRPRGRDTDNASMDPEVLKTVKSKKRDVRRKSSGSGGHREQNLLSGGGIVGDDMPGAEGGVKRSSEVKNKSSQQRRTRTSDSKSITSKSSLESQQKLVEAVENARRSELSSRLMGTVENGMTARRASLGQTVVEGGGVLLERRSSMEEGKTHQPSVKDLRLTGENMFLFSLEEIVIQLVY